MRQLISSLCGTYYQKLEKVELWLLKKILSNDDITATDIVSCYGSCEALLQDLCESDYEDNIIDFKRGSTIN